MNIETYKQIIKKLIDVQDKSILKKNRYNFERRCYSGNEHIEGKTLTKSEYVEHIEYFDELPPMDPKPHIGGSDRSYIR
jgi:hypothetical protein